MNLPGFRLHPLKGDFKGYWGGNTCGEDTVRIVFLLEDGAATDVDLLIITERTSHVDEEPPHPGRIVRQECIEPLGLTVTAAAKGLGITRKTLSELVNGKSGICSWKWRSGCPRRSAAVPKSG